MTGQILLYGGAAITIIWGIAHLFPTKSVVKGFGDISNDNKYIIIMEWIIEGVALIFIGFIVVGAAYIGIDHKVSVFVFFASSIVLIVLAIISLFTGFKVNFIPFKLCPLFFSASALLIIVGWLISTA
jgi:hypothetical protein